MSLSRPLRSVILEIGNILQFRERSDTLALDDPRPAWADLKQYFGEKVFRTIIPRNIRLAEAPSFGVPALFHDKDSRGALAYLALAGEMIRREEEEAGHASEADSL